MTYQHEWEKGDLIRIGLGAVDNYSFVHKFGEALINTDLVPVCFGTAYRTPTAPQTLVCKSSNSADTSTGLGGREITIEYLDSNFYPQIGTMALNGTAESVDTIPDVMRVYRFWLSKSGNYANQTQASHFGEIQLTGSGGGQLWAIMPELVSSFGAGQSLIGCYTVPAGHTAYILSQKMTVDSNKATDFYFFKRSNIEETTAPFTGTMRVQNTDIGVKEPVDREHKTIESFSEKTDIGYLAKGGASGYCSVDFELLLVATTPPD